MKKLILTILLLFSVAHASIVVRPEVAIGKEVNGNRAIEIIPIRVSWEPIPEWCFKFGLSVNYTKARSGEGPWNHFSEGVLAKVEWKPVHYIARETIKDFTISFTKSFSREYEGATYPVSYVPFKPYERLGFGFRIDFD